MLSSSSSQTLSASLSVTTRRCLRANSPAESGGAGPRSHGQRLINDFKDFSRLDRLDDDVVDATGFGELPRFLFYVMRRKKNNRRVRDLAITAQFSHEFVAIHLRHENVGNDQIGLFFADHFERFCATVRLKQAMPEMCQQRHENPPMGRAIIDDENLFDPCFGGAILEGPGRCPFLPGELLRNKTSRRLAGRFFMRDTRALSVQAAVAGTTGLSDGIHGGINDLFQRIDPCPGS